MMKRTEAVKKCGVWLISKAWKFLYNYLINILKISCGYQDKSLKYSCSQLNFT